MGKVTIKIDSGAIDTCIPPSVGKAFDIKESHMSRSNMSYRAANGTAIKNHGQRNLAAIDESWNPFKIEVQVADVSTPLASVFQICKSGNAVVFDQHGGAIINSRTRQSIPIRVRNGSYEMDMWLPKESRGSNNTSMDFIRRGM